MEWYKIRREMDLKSKEISEWRYAVDKVTNALKEAAGTIAEKLGMGLAAGSAPGGVAQHSNIVIRGDKVRGICPKCGAPAETSIESDKLICPRCNTIIAERRKTEEESLT
ncbi:MAG TPA: hypothetical protein ENG16_01850 [Archaeoglobus sp.]|nr:hypothetical protein [Archaeoglobus sp.]